MAFLVPNNVRVEHGLEIKEKIIPWGAKWPKDAAGYEKGDQFKADRKLSGGTGKVQYITIHNTDDIAEAEGTNDAEQYTRATWPNANMGDSRVHYFIDETDCWQNLREDEVGWHAGDGGHGPGNDTSLAIEIIMDGSGDAVDKAAEDRGALLAAILLNKHDLGIDRLTTHRRWNGKNCPAYILPHWSEFKTKVEKYLKQIQNEPAEPKQPDTLYRVQVGAFREKANAEKLLKDLKADGYDGFITSSAVEEKTETSWWDSIKHFSRKEFECHCGGKYCNGYPAEPAKVLVQVADRVRKHFGAPAIVSSGVRCKTHNANVGGVSNSRHLSGKAMDFCVVGKTAEQVLAYVEKQPEINYAYAIDSEYVHMDIL